MMVFRYRVSSLDETSNVSFLPNPAELKPHHTSHNTQSHITEPQSHATCQQEHFSAHKAATRSPLKTPCRFQDAAKNVPSAVICTAELANPHTFRQPSRARHSSCRWNIKETSPRYSTTTMDGMPASLEEWRNRLFHVTEVMTLTEEE